MPEFPQRMMTRRAVLRKISLDDALGWKAFNNRIAKRMSAEGLAWPIVPSVVYARNEIMHYIHMWSAGTRYVYIIIDRRTGKIIGDFHLKHIDVKRKRVEFGHALSPATWGTGLTYETLDAVSGMLRRRGFTPWARVEETNIRSWKSLEKYKARFKGVRRAIINGKPARMRIYEL